MKFWKFFQKQLEYHGLKKKVYRKIDETFNEIAASRKRVLEESPEFNKIAVEVTKIAQTLYPSLRPDIIDVPATIVKHASYSAMILMEAIPESFSKKEDEINIFFEIVCFLTHMSSRFVFKEFGPPNRQKLNDIIGPILVEYTVSTFYKPISKESPKHYAVEFKQKFYDYLNTSEIEYSACTAWVLKGEEDVANADKACGLKSKGLLNLLADNVAKILNISNPITHWRIVPTLSQSFELDKLKDIALKVRI